MTSDFHYFFLQSTNWSFYCPRYCKALVFESWIRMVLMVKVDLTFSYLHLSDFQHFFISLSELPCHHEVSFPACKWTELWLKQMQCHLKWPWYIFHKAVTALLARLIARITTCSIEYATRAIFCSMMDCTMCYDEFHLVGVSCFSWYNGKLKLFWIPGSRL